MRNVTTGSVVLEGRRIDDEGRFPAACELVAIFLRTQTRGRVRLSFRESNTYVLPLSRFPLVAFSPSLRSLFLCAIARSSASVPFLERLFLERGPVRS